MQNTPYMRVLLGDFYAKCTNWYKHDKTNSDPANTLRKSNVILWLFFGKLRNLLSANVDGT